MGAKAMNSPGHTHAAKSLPPGNSICLPAVLNRQCIRRLGPASDEPIYVFLDVDERLFHDGVRVGH
jgi:hypothetical protein